MLRRRFLDRVRAATAAIAPIESTIKRVALEMPNPARVAPPVPAAAAAAAEGAMVPNRL